MRKGKGTNQVVHVLAMMMVWTLIFTGIPSMQTFANTGKVVDVWDFGAKLQQGELYKNHITTKDIDALTNLGADGKTIEPGLLSLDNGAIEIDLQKQERFYYFSEDQKSKGTKSAGDPNKKNTFEQDLYGYTGSGYFYYNGAGNEEKRYILIHNVHRGDRITVYGFEDNVTSSIAHFDFIGEPEDGQIIQKASAQLGTPFIYDVTALNTGTYKLWFDSNGGKMRIHRIVRAPYVEVTGKIDLAGNTITNYSVEFLNKSTKQAIQAVVSADGTYKVDLAPGYEYIAVLKNVTGYGFTNASKVVSININDIVTDKAGVILKVEAKQLYTLSGKISGFGKGYDLSKLEIKLNPPKDDSITQAQNAAIDKQKMTYSVTLEPNIFYTLELLGVNDYRISAGESCISKADISKDIKVETKPIYSVSGNLVAMAEGATVKGISFINLEDGYSYSGAVKENSYSAKLRNGAYQVKLESDTYSTLAHVVVNKDNTSKDLMVSLIKPVAKEYQWVSDLYVGYAQKDNNFNTITQAVAAAKSMNIQDEAHRVTIHIAPGVYRQQLIVDTPYLTFVNDEPSKEVKLTWYYGIGYKYYSARALDNGAGTKGYYDVQYAFDQYEKSPVDKWGTSVLLTSAAKGFKAKNIVFENSFNRYVTQEEIADGVEVAGTSDIKLERKIDSPVATKAYKERAAAMYIDADQVEFENCSFLSNQDTLGTGSAGTHKYFKNCLIEGGTDYICGAGDCVFDNCQLNWYGASDAALSGQVITAAKADAKGYLFRNCTITTKANSNDKNMPATGLFGRPWDQGAKVAFINTKFAAENIIDKAGWTSMSSATPDKASFFEYNSTYNGKPIDIASRAVTLISATAKPEDYEVKSFFGEGWIPSYYIDDSKAAPEFETKPQLTSDAEVITVQYKFKNNSDNLNDASLIQWYRVDSKGAETLIECQTAYISKSYTKTAQDKGFKIKAVITPEVVSGLKAASAAVQSEK